jgi:glyceraldehyde-3-phosphate dehydrogenase (NADP+)
MNKQTLEKIFGDTQRLHITEKVNQVEYLIDGKILLWDGPKETVYSPCMGVELGTYPMLSEKESMLALNAAERAYKVWSLYSLEQRTNCVGNFVVEMRKQRERVVNLIMWEIAKTRKDAEKEFDRTVEDILAKIEEAKNLDRESSIPKNKDGIFAQIRRSPLGVSLLLSAFNYPINETYTLLFPSLLMGNTVIFKTPKMGILLHRPMLEAFRDCFPEGVVNTLYGDGPTVIGPLMASGRIDSLGFIGTSKVADILVKQHPKPHRLRRIIGAEAKNPGIILEDADIDNTVKECVTGTLSFNGQRCTALKILFVEQRIAVEFMTRFCKAIDNLKPGYPWTEGVDLTPLPEPGKIEYLQGLVKDAQDLGAGKVNYADGGGIVHGKYFHPAVLFPVNSHMRVYHEEQFGPVIPIVPFEEIGTVLDYVKTSNYGQQASIFSQDPKRISELVDYLSTQVCRININTQCQRGPDSFPFTGRKDSAEGTVSNTDTFKAFSIRTMVAAKNDEKVLRAIYENNFSQFMNTDYIF